MQRFFGIRQTRRPKKKKQKPKKKKEVLDRRPLLNQGMTRSFPKPASSSFCFSLGQCRLSSIVRLRGGKGLQGSSAMARDDSENDLLSQPNMPQLHLHQFPVSGVKHSSKTNRRQNNTSVAQSPLQVAEHLVPFHDFSTSVFQVTPVAVIVSPLLWALRKALEMLLGWETRSIPNACLRVFSPIEAIVVADSAMRSGGA